jgi:hypothetical protein
VRPRDSPPISLKNLPAPADQFPEGDEDPGLGVQKDLDVIHLMEETPLRCDT